MALTITVDDRDWDVEQITACLVIPAAREYVAALTVDDSNARPTFVGDVVLKSLDAGAHRLTVAQFHGDDPVLPLVGAPFTVNVADIRSISFY